MDAMKGSGLLYQIGGELWVWRLCFSPKKVEKVKRLSHSLT